MSLRPSPKGTSFAPRGGPLSHLVRQSMDHWLDEVMHEIPGLRPIKSPAEESSTCPTPLNKWTLTTLPV